MLRGKSELRNRFRRSVDIWTWTSYLSRRKTHCLNYFATINITNVASFFFLTNSRSLIRYFLDTFSQWIIRIKNRLWKKITKNKHQLFKNFCTISVYISLMNGVITFSKLWKQLDIMQQNLEQI